MHPRNQNCWIYHYRILYYELPLPSPLIQALDYSSRGNLTDGPGGPGGPATPCIPWAPVAP